MAADGDHFNAHANIDAKIEPFYRYENKANIGTRIKPFSDPTIAARALSEVQQDYVFASLMDPSPTPVSFEVLLWDRPQLHLYQVNVFIQGILAILLFPDTKCTCVCIMCLHVYDACVYDASPSLFFRLFPSLFPSLPSSLPSSLSLSLHLSLSLSLSLYI